MCFHAVSCMRKKKSWKIKENNFTFTHEKNNAKTFFFFYSVTHMGNKKKSPGKNTDGKINEGTQVLPG